jgi:hypothetical protein
MHTAALLSLCKLVPSKRVFTLAVPCSELGERYNALVVASGVLSEQEFWAGVAAERSGAAVRAAAGSISKGAGGAVQGGGGGGTAGGADALLPLPPPVEASRQQLGLSNAMFRVPVSCAHGAA